MKREPLVTVAFVLSAVGAVLGLLKAFGVDLTDDQQAAISAVASVIAPLLVAVLVRPRVTPVEPGPVDAGYGLVQALVVVALVLVIVFLGVQLFDVDFRG